ncbi:hypothetical protein KCP69_19310 [Salmonella enterica subsp. enterica]|nr:hypothetical protein KCP69_19310 [Salmonella enterica subsp. enterica]
MILGNKSPASPCHHLESRHRGPPASTSLTVLIPKQAKCQPPHTENFGNESNSPAQQQPQPTS